MKAWHVLLIVAGVAVLAVMVAGMWFGHRLVSTALARPHLERGYARMAADDIDGAVEAFTRAIELDADHGRAYNARGQALAERGDYEAALEDFERVNELAPSEPAAHHNGALVHWRLGQYDEAVRGYSEAIRLRPHYAGSYLWRGVAWRKVGDDDRAVADFTRAVELEPALLVAYHERAVAFEMTGRYGRALQDLTHVVEAFDSPPEGPGETDRKLLRTSLNNRAWILATCPDPALRDGNQAVEDATRACELADWQEEDFLDTLAAACAEAGDFDAAVRWQTKALKRVSDWEKDDFRGRLELYRAGKPYRQPPGE